MNKVKINYKKALIQIISHLICRCRERQGLLINLMRSGLLHRHLIDGMKVTILTTSLRPMFTVTLVRNTKKLAT